MAPCQPAVVTERVLHEVVARHGQEKRDPDQHRRTERADTARRAGRPQHEHRPVPQVPGVRDVSHPRQWTDREDAGRTDGVGAHPGGDQGGGAEDREQGRPSGEPCRGVEGDDGEQDGAEPGGGQQPAESPRSAGKPCGTERQEGADPELPRTTGGGEVRRGPVVTDQVHRPAERRDAERRDEARGGAPTMTSVCRGASGDGHQEEKEEWPHQVELLLDRQRPVVLHRRRRESLGEVVGAQTREVDVGQEGRRPGGVGRHLLHAGVGQLPRREGERRDQHDRGGRQDPASAARVEPEQSDPPGPLGLPHQQGGDEVARQDEEHVDADVATGHGPDPGVIGDDGHHGDRAESLDVAADHRARSSGDDPRRARVDDRVVAWHDHGRAGGPGPHRSPWRYEGPPDPFTWWDAADVPEVRWPHGTGRPGGART